MNNFDFDDDLPFSPAYENDVDNKEKENNKKRLFYQSLFYNMCSYNYS